MKWLTRLNNNYTFQTIHKDVLCEFVKLKFVDSKERRLVKLLLFYHFLGLISSLINCWFVLTFYKIYFQITSSSSMNFYPTNFSHFHIQPQFYILYILIQPTNQLRKTLEQLSLLCDPIHRSSQKSHSSCFFECRTSCGPSLSK